MTTRIVITYPLNQPRELTIAETDIVERAYHRLASLAGDNVTIDDLKLHVIDSCERPRLAFSGPLRQLSGPESRAIIGEAEAELAAMASA